MMQYKRNLLINQLIKKYNINILSKYSKNYSMNYQYLCYLLLLLQIKLINTQIVQLFRLSVQLSDDCWVLDTNNYTEIGMGNCFDEVYYVNLGLGTPPLFSNFQIDTFRDLIWFPLNQTYVNSSQTFQITNKTTVTYMHKSLYEGTKGSDIVSVLQTNISTRSSVVWSEKQLNLPTYPYIDGILGLGYSQTPNFLDNAAQNNQINSSIFALQMGGLGQPSVLYYSELPSFLESATIYVPVVGQKLWQVQVKNIKVDGFDFSAISPKKMIIDTTTGVMYLNPNLYKKILSKFFNSCKTQSNNKVVCECWQDWPDIQIIFQDVSITIDSDCYFKRNQYNQCILLIGQTMQQQSPMVVGGSLMKDYILTFDKQNQQVGFNGHPLGAWRQIFLIFQLIAIIIIMISFVLGVYLLLTVRYIKNQKLEKKEAKKEGKVKKVREKNGKQKLIQLSTQFLEEV